MMNPEQKKSERMDLDKIQKVLELMKENDLSEFELEDEGFRLAAKRGPGGTSQILVPAAPAHATVSSAASAPAATTVPAPADAHLAEIVSPMVGTFYRASSPETPPFISVGQEVESDTVVCIVEAMKVMNEVKAETRGIVRKVCVENATAVQFGSVLFKIEPLD
jgi:acetyl-CoA carboxylase biotin carboxyl carrier protein